jgi:hypothetical protein
VNHSRHNWKAPTESNLCLVTSSGTVITVPRTRNNVPRNHRVRHLSRTYPSSIEKYLTSGARSGFAEIRVVTLQEEIGESGGEMSFFMFQCHRP